MGALIIMFGCQHEHTEQGVARLAERFPDIAVRFAQPDAAPGDTAMAVPVRLAWLFVNETNVGLPAVSQWCRHLSAVAPVTVACYISNGEAPAATTERALPPGTFLQPYTADTAQQVLDVIAGFLLRVTQAAEAASPSRNSPANA